MIWMENEIRLLADRRNSTKVLIGVIELSKIKRKTVEEHACLKRT